MYPLLQFSPTIKRGRKEGKGRKGKERKRKEGRRVRVREEGREKKRFTNEIEDWQR